MPAGSARLHPRGSVSATKTCWGRTQEHTLNKASPASSLPARERLFAGRFAGTLVRLSGILFFSVVRMRIASPAVVVVPACPALFAAVGRASVFGATLRSGSLGRRSGLLCGRVRIFFRLGTGCGSPPGIAAVRFGLGMRIDISGLVLGLRPGRSLFSGGLVFLFAVLAASLSAAGRNASGSPRPPRRRTSARPDCSGLRTNRPSRSTLLPLLVGPDDLACTRVHTERPTSPA